MIELLGSDGRFEPAVSLQRDSPRDGAFAEPSSSMGAIDDPSGELQAAVLQGRAIIQPRKLGSAEGEPSDATSSVILPMKSRGRLIGLASGRMSLSGRRFELDDLAFLEELVRRSSVAIENALLLRRANQAVKAREDLLSSVSHDLANPLNVLSLRIETGLRSPPVGDDRRRFSRSQLQAMQRSVERMTRLVRDLLDQTSVESGHFQLEQRMVSLSPLIQDVIDSLMPLAVDRSIHLESSWSAGLPKVFADGDRLAQVLSNLVSNALKFTPAGGRVTVEALSDGQQILMRVTDNGKGIAADDLPYLFDQYWKAAETGRLGTGLGLYISKHIVEAHGGRIWAESELGRGARFTVALPYGPPT